MCEWEKGHGCMCDGRRMHVCKGRARMERLFRRCVYMELMMPKILHAKDYLRF